MAKKSRRDIENSLSTSSIMGKSTPEQKEAARKVVESRALRQGWSEEEKEQVLLSLGL